MSVRTVAPTAREPRRAAGRAAGCDPPVQGPGVSVRDVPCGIAGSLYVVLSVLMVL
ncbi:hypothetical protein [Streptomyces sp. NBC_01294]|uniref:hypothetical protein n=1 Tax=Streptomyces sp. NBC_01294 TaxID=2903815 RepID=UPI002DDC6E4C|nr:hypothetical protein [Streptomyces sp. NBC_01294]WRZ60639.1 hypothetical protein OG534_31630 [Streptomyces sp. NBC_01294]